MTSKFVGILAGATLLVAGIADVTYHGRYADGWFESRIQKVLRQNGFNEGWDQPITSPVDDARAMLRGPVSTEADRLRAAAIVEDQVWGLRSITNNLTVVHRVCAREVLASLQTMVEAEPDQSRISYLVDGDCNVALTGWVPTEERKKGIGQVASSAPGVAKVSNNIQVGFPKEKLQDTLIQILRVQNIYFDFNKSTIREESLPALDKVAAALKDHLEYRVKIEGHTDSISGDQYNLDLSEKRARAVRDALVERGIADERLEYKGFGETMPIAPNDTPEGRAENRRIEFKVL